MVDWLEDRCQEGEITESSPVLDVGCGNGLLSVSLCHVGFTCVTGVDYSAGAVQLATKIAGQHDCQATFHTLDLLDSHQVSNYRDQFRIVVDKGTFDAVSLSENSVSDKEKYVESVAAVLQAGGLLLITSCNWTEPELANTSPLTSPYGKLSPPPPLPSVARPGKAQLS